MTNIIYELIPVTELNKSFVTGEFRNINIPGANNIPSCKYIAVKKHTEAECYGQKCAKHTLKRPLNTIDISNVVYEIIPVTWLNESLVKDMEILEFMIKDGKTSNKQKFVRVLKHTDKQCSGRRCPKHPLKTPLFAKMDDMNGWKWGDYLTRQ